MPVRQAAHERQEKRLIPMPTLLFVYNADSGLFNTLTDIAHQIFSPQTYACNLCALTHTPLGMKKEWRAFLTEIPLPLQFLHADELRLRHGDQGVTLPAVFHAEGDRLTVWLAADAINRCKTLAELQLLIKSRLAEPV
jgi:hypothetical protein